MNKRPAFTIERLRWEDEELGTIELPRAPLRLTRSFGSGLTRRAFDPPGHFWAVGDRGPNLEIATMIERYGAERLARHRSLRGAKVMPRLDIGPSIARLRVAGDVVVLVAAWRVADGEGAPISGLPMPGSEHSVSEPALTLDGEPIPPDPSGLDTEGIVALEDGTFVLSEEFGPSLVRLDKDARVLGRYVPSGMDLPGARYPVHQTLPAIAAKRQLNRGFEAIAVSEDQRRLFVAFQSPLAHPDEAAHEQARHIRLWQVDVATMRVAGQYLYPLDPPESFLRDSARGAMSWSDLKISDLVCLPDGGLLALERGSQTTKIYRFALQEDYRLPPEHLELATRPTVEQLSGRGEELTCVDKQLVLSTDEAEGVSADLEGIVLLSPSELLLVNDSDFGVEGAGTAFWRVRFAQPQFA